MMASSPVPLTARTAVAELAVASVSAASAAAAELAGVPTLTLEGTRIAVAYSSERWLRTNGQKPVAFAPLSGFFPTRDGWVRTHGNYPHHARALIRALGAGTPAEPADAAVMQTEVSARLRALPSAVAAERITDAGGLCVAVATEDSDLDARLRDTPLVHTARLAAGPAVPFHSGPAAAPLSGIRVLDLTRVIAGPVATRTLALLGADVLRVDDPRLPELPWQHLDTGHGKRSTLLDLRSAADRAVFDALLSTADIIVLGYRPRGLDALGLSPADLVARRPGVIVARLSAWGDPDRRGFDSLVQAASGIAWIEAAGAVPGALPAQALDHSAGYLLAAEIMRLLRQRAEEGGAWLAETSLRRIAAELLGLPRRADPDPATPIDPTGHLQEFDVDGILLTTAAPALAYAGAPVVFAPPRRWGSDAPQWREGP